MLKRELMLCTRAVGVLLLTAPCFNKASAAEPGNSRPDAPMVAEASGEGELAIKGLQLPSGFKAELIAAEPHLANPVAFYIDHSGKIFVAETFRHGAGVTDIRGHNNWLDEDLASRTVDDRLAMLRRHEGSHFPNYSKQSDRIKLLEDRDGDGKIDHSTVFADGFYDPLSGIGSGVLSWRGETWYANIPDLWLLKDSDQNGVAEFRKSLHHGFGVRVGFLGHDLHGLRLGPDGKLYFSIGDRGTSVDVGHGTRVGDPDSGAVYRCNRDGSDLELFAFGLRNPQEIIFDQYGNLFTGDNNSDGGDRARWVYLVEGGDSGWRIGYQFIESPNARGPWNAEKLWHPKWDGQAAYLLPPIANVSDGPSGLTYYPGTGLPEKYAGHFFLVDFKGSRGSGIHSFKVEPAGATFRLANRENFVWEALPTDVDFGLDGGVYFTDWVQGWGKTGKGRVYRVYNPDTAAAAIVIETRKLLQSDFRKKSIGDLSRLLNHADMRVRQEAQFELSFRGRKGLEAFIKTTQNGSQLAKIHSLWGLGQIGREQASLVIKALLDGTRDKDAEVRSQAAKVLADLKLKGAEETFISLLKDPEPRPRFFAAIGLGKLRSEKAFDAVVELLRENNDKDVYIRHAAVMALTGIGNTEALLARAKDESSAVRMGILLALRRLQRAEVGVFLKDSSPLIVTEAARAINDVPISGAMLDLAGLTSNLRNSEVAPELGRRIVNANLRVGIQQTAEHLGSIAADPGVPEAFRAEALRALGNWEQPSGRDRVTGLWRPVVGPRKQQDAVKAIEPRLATILSTAPESVQRAAARAIAQLGINSSGGDLAKLVQSSGSSAVVRVESLRALAELNHDQLAAALDAAQNDNSEEVRREAIKLGANAKPTGAIGQLASILESGSAGEKQSAFAALANIEGNSADELLLKWMEKLKKGEVPQEIVLDLIEAVAKRSSAIVKSKLQEYEATLPASDELKEFQASLVGGNAAEGKKIFHERADAACLRCHKINGEGGEVGPELTGLGQKQNRQYILEAIVYPNKHIAPGYESVIVTTKSGIAYAGVIKSENDQELVLNSPEDGIVTLKKTDVTGRERGLSGMPEGLGSLLTKQELRNLIEFLATSK
ncbi:MAG: HEAT repeat domain-containing protein [Verrucomicrobiota bacterium]|nr:HEAT repeat domain-containing protein [Verrucomicrobiota bacterium]